MIFIPCLLFTMALLNAAPTSPADDLTALRRELMTLPSHDTARFATALERYLVARSMTGLPPALGDLVDRIGVFTRTEDQKKIVFRILALEDSGLTATEVADVIMSDSITEYGVRMWASSAFQKLVGSDLPLAAGHVSKRQMEIFEKLAPYAFGFEDWEQLVLMPGNHPDVRPWISRVMIESLGAFEKWPLKMKEWRKIFSYYEPEFHDTDEKHKLLQRFGDYTRMLVAVETVADWRVRADLQEAIIQRVRLPSQGVVRTVLAPIGESQPLVYQAYLEKLREKYLARARPTDCEHLVSVWTTEHTMKGQKTRGPRALPPGWRVIENRD